MTHPSSLPTYFEIGGALQEAGLDFNPSQVHGLLCGYICAMAGKAKNSWEKLLPGCEKNPACKELLEQLYEMSYHEMTEFSFDFAILLPEDEADINYRTEALGLWCQGFLTALEQANVPIRGRQESEVTDAINNMIEIAQVNYGDITENDEDETAYFELAEYVRLAVLMIFQDLRSDSTTPKKPRKSNQLH